MMKSLGTKVKHFAGEATPLHEAHRNPQQMWMWMNLVKQWKETGLLEKMKHPFENQEAIQMLHAHFCRSCTTAKGSYRKISTNRLKTSSS